MIITPYAELGLEFTKRPARDAANGGRGRGARQGASRPRPARRSETMPERATEARFHPSSSTTCCCSSCCCARARAGCSASSPPTSPAWTRRSRRCRRGGRGGREGGRRRRRRRGAKLAALGSPKHERAHDPRQALCDATAFKPPEGSTSPAGEYNLRLGIQKELQPEFIATTSLGAAGGGGGAALSHEGHAFAIEAGVSSAGPSSARAQRVPAANRIPLLFEAGADARARRAHQDHGRATRSTTTDKVGVFVST